MTNVAPSMGVNVLRRNVVLVGTMYMELVPDCLTLSAAYQSQIVTGEKVRQAYQYH